MKKLQLLIVSLMLLLPANVVFGQLSLLLKSGEQKLEANSSEFLNDQGVQPSEIVQGSYYRILQFAETPTTLQKSQLKSAGIELVEFLPEKAFYAAIDIQADVSILADFNVYAVSRIERDFKLTTSLIEKKISGLGACRSK